MIYIQGDTKVFELDVLRDTGAGPRPQDLGAIVSAQVELVSAAGVRVVLPATVTNALQGKLSFTVDPSSGIGPQGGERESAWSFQVVLDWGPVLGQRTWPEQGAPAQLLTRRRL